MNQRQADTARLIEIQAEVRGTARQNPRLVDLFHRAYESVRALMARHADAERQQRADEVRLAEELLERGYTFDPALTDQRPCIPVPLEGLCPAAVAGRLRHAGQQPPEALQREAAPHILEAIRRHRIYQTADKSAQHEMAREHRDRVDSEDMAHARWTVWVARPEAWPYPLDDPLSNDPERLRRFTPEDFAAIAAYRLGGLADAQLARPFVPEPEREVSPNVFEAALRLIHWRARFPASKFATRPHALPPDPDAFPPALADEMWAVVRAQLAPGGDDDPIQTDINRNDAAGARDDDAGSNRKPLPKLKPHDRQAYQLSIMHGMTQTNVAAMLNREHGTKYSQGCVSKMIARAKRHADASGLSEHLPKPASRPRTVDPDRLELGPRADRRKPRPSDTARAHHQDP